LLSNRRRSTAQKDRGYNPQYFSPHAILSLRRRDQIC
jgi:hypothetical protein